MPLPERFTDLAREVNNWGRWGADDELGTLNLITSEAIQRAVASVMTGSAFPLALPLHADGPQTGAIPGRINPVHLMTAVNQSYGEACVNDDSVVMGLQCATHWDALSHVTYRGTLYNGFAADTVTEEGASRCSIDKVTSLIGRGVLIDVARAHGVERLDPGYAITGADLDAAVQTDVAAGDIVLVRTGHIRFLADGDKRSYGYPSPGIGLDAVRWLHAHDVAAAATDTLAFEVLPGEIDDLFLPVHMLHLVEMGMIQGQNFWLEDLAADCADDGRYTFLLEATPEPFVRAVGAPVCPVAIK